MNQILQRCVRMGDHLGRTRRRPVHLKSATPETASDKAGGQCFGCHHLVARILIGVYCVFASTFLMVDAWGQAGIMAMQRTTNSARFIEAPRYIQQELREAERAIAEERMSDAIVRLGDLLQRDPANATETDLSGQDFFIPAENNRTSRLSDSNLHRARRMIGELPASAIEIYELRYGPLARKTLDEAALVRDWYAVQDVRRKYFHTLAGYEASLLLAQNELFMGHPLAASLLLDDVVDFPRAVNHLGQSVKMIHAAAMKLAGRELDSLELPQKGKLTISGTETDWPSADRLSDWIDERFSRQQRNAGGTLRDYAMFGGRPDRNEVSAGQMPLANARWKLPTTATPKESRTIDKVSTDLTALGQLPPPTLMPLRVGEYLLMRTTNRVFGVNYKTGKRTWNYPWYPVDETTDDDEAPPTVLSQGEGNTLLSQRVWNDLPYGQITSDGERVFFVDDLSEIEVVSISAMGRRGSRPANAGTNTLVALDLRTEGSLLWRLGEGSDQASSLFDAFFLGPPLPLDGRLYVMAEVAGDILLVCLDPATGNEIWRQQLVAVESGAIDMDAVRRVVGATPTFHEGLLLCPTGAGATVAVDLVDRMLRWGTTYPRQRAFRESMNSRNGRFNPSQLMQRWHSGTAIAIDNAMYMTPPESDTLMCLDLLTGAKRFADMKRNDLSYMAGVRDGQIIMVAPRFVSALDAETGALKWRTDEKWLATGQQIVGRGVFGDDDGNGDYLVPTSSDELVRISLKDGKVLQRRSTRYALGNLIAVDGEVISQSSTSLAVAYGERSLEPLVNQKLKEDPNDFDALVRKSELLIQRGERSEALELLQRARKIDSESIEVHTLSVTAMLGLLREGKEGSDELADQLDSMIDRPGERVELLSLQIRASLKKKDPVRAASRLIKLSQLINNNDGMEDAGKYVMDDPSRECSLDSWLAARMADVKELSDEKQVEAINEKVSEIVKRKLEGSKSSLTSVVKHFTPFDVTTPLSVLANMWLKEESYLSLERTILGVTHDVMKPLETISGEKLLLLAKSYARGGMGHDAVPLIDELRDRESDLATEKELSDLESLAKQRFTDPVWSKKVALEWQSGQEQRRGLSQMSRERSQMRTEVIASETFRGWQLVSEGGSTLSMRDPNGRTVGMPMGSLIQRDVGDRSARINAGMMLLVRGGELKAVDLHKILSNQGIDSEIWERRFGGDGSSSTTRRSVPTKFGVAFFRYLLSASKASPVPGEFRVGTMLGDRVFVLNGGDLMAVDLLTSKTLWRNSTAPPQGAVVSDGKRVAVVCKPLEKTVFYDALDGAKLGEEKWEHGEVWAETGQNVLCFSETEDRWRYNLRVVNPLSGEVLLETVSASANRSQGEERAFGKLISQRYMLLLNTEGNLKIWDILMGKELVDTEIGKYPDLKAIHGMELDDKLVVFPERLDSMATSVDGEESQTEQGLFHKTADGLFAFSIDDGKQLWTKEFDSPWGCTLSQPGRTPMLLLTRLRWRLDGTGPRKMKMDALAVDVDNGETLHERLGTVVSSRMSQQQAKIVVQSVQDRVVVQIGNEVLSYKFGVTDAELEKEKEGGAGKADEQNDGLQPADSIDDLFGN